MGLYRMLDPDQNMDHCCFGAMGAKKGALIIGILEIIGVLAVAARVLTKCIITGEWPVLLVTAVTVIALANIATIGLMFSGLKTDRAWMVSVHLIVHVVNIISLVFALLMSSMLLVEVNTEAAATVSTTTMRPKEPDQWANVKWAVQLSISAVCLILETWFFNVEYTIFLQLCDRDKPIERPGHSKARYA